MSAPASGAAPLAGVGLTRTFGARTVLDGASLEVERGEVHAVVGPSGAGKTTLLRILNLLDAPSAGTVRYGGHDVQLASPSSALVGPQHDARLAMALVPQKPVAFRASVFDNAAYGLRLRGVDEAEIQTRVTSTLDKLGIGPFADEPARRLSGGETQRLAFARAAVLTLEFLLLDEFTANLDAANVRTLERAVSDIAHESGVGVLIVTHDLFQARRIADRVTVLMDGKVVESGPKADVLDSTKDPRARSFLHGDLAY